MCHTARVLHVRFAVAVLACLPLYACADSGNGASPSTTSATTVPVTGLCTLVSEGHLEALFGSGFVFGTPDSTERQCNWPVETANGASRGRIYLGGSGIPYDKTVADSKQLGQEMTDVEGLGARAHFTAHDLDALYWITIEDGSGTLSVAAEYQNGAVPPPEAELIAVLKALAAEYIAGR